MKKALKLAFVANSSWSIINYRKGVLQYFHQKGVQIYTIAPRDNRTHELIQSGYHHIDIRTENDGIKSLENLSLFIKLFKIYKKHQFDLVFHYTVKPNIFGSLAAGFQNIPSIALVTGAGYTFKSKNALFYATKGLYKLVKSFYSEMWFLNEQDKNEFLELGLVKKSKAKILPSEGVDLQHFMPREKESQSSGFLYLGRLLSDKGIFEFVEAAKIVKEKYPDVEFKVLGFLDVSNPEMISSEQVLEWQKNGIIEYLGESKDVRKEIHAASCVVLPSYYREGIPRSLLEAAALAKPIISTNNVGCVEVVKDGYNGFLCEIRNPISLAEKMIKLIEMRPIDKEIMGWNGRSYVEEKFDEKYVIRYYDEAFKKYCPSALNIDKFEEEVKA